MVKCHVVRYAHRLSHRHYWCRPSWHVQRTAAVGNQITSEKMAVQNDAISSLSMLLLGESRTFWLRNYLVMTDYCCVRRSLFSIFSAGPLAPIQVCITTSTAIQVQFLRWRFTQKLAVVDHTLGLLSRVHGMMTFCRYQANDRLKIENILSWPRSLNDDE